MLKYIVGACIFLGSACGPPCDRKDSECVAKWAVNQYFPDSEQRLQDYKVEILNVPYFISPAWGKVRGLTFCRPRYIRLANGNDIGAYAHELLHIYHCPEEKNNFSHYKWHETGENDAAALAASYTVNL